MDRLTKSGKISSQASLRHTGKSRQGEGFGTAVRESRERIRDKGDSI